MTKKDENQDRGNWDSKADYLLSCIGYAVGLGNVWRFPYLAFKNGGGAFIIPYVVMLIFAGLPIFFLECSMGQFSSLGPTAVWKFNPLFKGVGFCMVTISAFVGIYYNVIIAYTVFYFFASLTSQLPWATCDGWWNSADCSTVFKPVCSVNLSQIAANDLLTNFLQDNNSFTGTGPVFKDVLKADIERLEGEFNVNRSALGCDEFRGKRGRSPSEEFWREYALNQAPDMEYHNSGVVNTHLALALIVAWIVVFYSLIRGIKSSGKVVYFTALFPYAVLMILLIRGATLEGAYEGVQYYMGQYSNMTKLQSAEVWKDAATQIFFSLSSAWGGLIALSSYNKFNNNCFFDAVLVCAVNCATSIFAGFAIFTIVGHMAHRLGQKVPDVVDAGFGLAFIAYPEAIVQLPISPLWSILFFLMLFTLGLDSQFTILETVVTAVVDAFPRRTHNRRWQLMLGVSVVMFLLGLNCCTDAGLYWVNLIDHYAAGWGLLIVAILELFGVCWIYGGNRFIGDIEMMIGKKSWWFWLYWRACWFFITPLLLMTILIWSLVTYTSPTMGGYAYPTFANIIGWLITATGLIFIPLYAIVALCANRFNIYKASSPRADWGPYLAKHRGRRYNRMADPVEAIEFAKYRNAKDSGKDNPAFNEDVAAGGVREAVDTEVTNL